MISYGSFAAVQNVCLALSPFLFCKAVVVSLRQRILEKPRPPLALFVSVFMLLLKDLSQTLAPS